MNRIFIGRDPRQPVAATVLAHSLYKHAKAPISVTMLDLHQLPITRKGLTEFTFSRYLVPYLCGYAGYALFMDADMIARADINELFDLVDDDKFTYGEFHDVWVVKSDIRFEWPSLMLFDCARCAALSPAYIDSPHSKPFALDWASSIGALPPEWNHCVGYAPRNPAAKVVHFTQGIPVWDETRGSEFAEEWWALGNESMGTCRYDELMAHSIHAGRQVDPLRHHDVRTGKDIER